MKLKSILSILSPFLFLLSCQNTTPNTQKTEAPATEVIDSNYKKTELPIQLEALTDKERQIMLDRQEADTSSYLAYSRPILFQIQGVESNQNQHRNTQHIYKDLDLLIYALGEAKDSVLVDYGWIENAATGETIWKMTYDKTEYGGGDKKNRKLFEKLFLPSGTYRLHYVSNQEHANGDWVGAAPERPFYYGITVFNLEAIDKIKELSLKDIK